jgi:DNA polymerase-1
MTVEPVATGKPASPLQDVQLYLVNSIDAAGEFKRWLGDRRRDVLGVDTETSGLHPERDDLRLVQIGDLHTGWAIPWEQWGGVALEALNSYTDPLVLHNSSFDARFLKTHAKWNPPWERIHDTLTQAHIADPGRPKGLKPLADRLIDPQATAGQKMLDKAMFDNKWDWGSVPVDFPYYWVYGALDPVLTCHVHKKLHSVVGHIPSYALELSAVRICAEMMLHGIKIDIDHCTTKSTELREWVKEMRSWVRDAYEVKNLTSNRQVIERLLQDGVPLIKKTRTGQYALDKEVLEAIAWHPLADAVGKVRRAEKTCGSYLDHMIELADEDGYVHCNINTLGAITGRMSITDPAFQTLFRNDRTVRNGVIPSEGNVLVAIDADQIEARLMAHFSNDPGLIDAFRSDEDFFCNIASMIFNDKVEKNDMRRDLTKNTVYGKCYCAGPEKMAQTAGVAPEVGYAVFDRFDHLYPGVSSYANEIINNAEMERAYGRTAYIETPYGRRIPAPPDKVYPLVNYSIQGPAAEILKRGMADIEAAGLSEYLVLPVHDELVMDVPKDLANDVLHTVEKILTNTTDYKVPLTWSGDIYEERWGPKK